MRKQITEQDISKAIRQAINEWMNLNVNQQDVQSGTKSEAKILCDKIRKNPVAFFTYNNDIKKLIKAAYQQGDKKFQREIDNACWANGVVGAPLNEAKEGIINRVKHRVQNTIGGVSAVAHNSPNQSGIGTWDAYHSGKQMVNDRREMKGVVHQIILMCGFGGRRLTGLQEILRIFCHPSAVYAANEKERKDQQYKLALDRYNDYLQSLQQFQQGTLPVKPKYVPKPQYPIKYKPQTNQDKQAFTILWNIIHS